MTATVDAKKRAVLPAAQPGDRFDLQVVEDGKLVLTRFGPTQLSPANVKVEKCGGFLMGVLDHSINDDALAEALREFP